MPAIIPFSGGAATITFAGANFGSYTPNPEEQMSP
jgi:hypothetical protein